MKHFYVSSDQHQRQYITLRNNQQIEIRYTYGGFNSEQDCFFKIINGLKNKKSGLKNEIGPNEAQNKTEDRTVQAEIISKPKLDTLMEYLAVNQMRFLNL